MWPFTGGAFTLVGSVTVCMRISLIELLLQSVMRWVPAPEYMLSGMRPLVLVGNECSCFQGHGAGHAYPESGSTIGGWLVAWVTPGLVRRCCSSCLTKRLEIDVVG
jgi:hypothetical protein